VKSILRKESLKKARKHFLKADANAKVAYCSLKLTRIGEAAEYYLLGKEYEQAAKYYALDGKHIKAAQIYEKIGKRIESAEMFFKGDDFEKAATIYRELKLLKKAEEMYVQYENFSEVSNMYKEHFEAEIKVLCTYLKLKKLQKVKALALKTGQYLSRLEKHEKAADIYIKVGLMREAAHAYIKMKNYEKAADLCLHIEDKLKAAQLYIEAKNYDKSIELYKEMGKLDEVADILEMAGRKAESSELRGRLSLERKDTELGARHLEEAGKYTEAAELYFGINKLRKSAELYEKGEKFERAAEIHEKLKNYEKAAELYKGISRYRSAANCYREIKDERACMEMLLLGEAFLEAAKFHMDKDEKDAAIEILQKIEIDSPDYRMACNILGKLFHEKNIIGLAREKLLKAVEGLEMGKRNLEIFYNMAVFHESQGEGADALKIFEKILSFDFYFKDVQDRRRILAEKIASQKNAPKIPITELTLTPSSAGVRPGKHNMKSDVINNRYEMVEEVGRGGMGIVYKAFDRSLDREVALKFLPQDFIKDTKDIEKFINEAKSAAKLNHINIITIHDIDQMDGDYFIVMEFVDGADLKEIIDLAHNLPFKTIHMVAEQICDALSYAHKNSVIHRDIKNANIMWTNEKIVKIADFGLAKIIEGGLKTSTRVQGSPVYMSPEQVIGKEVDHRTDLYSFGISLYEMCTGKVPFERGDIGYHHLNTLPEPPNEIRADLPQYLSEVIITCLRKRPEDRYQNATELLDFLIKNRQK